MSEVKVDKISPKTGTSMTVGDSGDTFTVPSGATLTVAGALNVTGTTSLADGTVNVAELIESLPKSHPDKSRLVVG